MPSNLKKKKVLSLVKEKKGHDHIWDSEDGVWLGFVMIVSSICLIIILTKNFQTLEYFNSLGTREK